MSVLRERAIDRYHVTRTRHADCRAIYAAARRASASAHEMMMPPVAAAFARYAMRVTRDKDARAL